MTRLAIIAALYAAKHGSRANAIRMTKLALSYANKEGHKSCAGHLLAALNKAGKPC